MDEVTTKRYIAEKLEFSWYDYGMFGLMLTLSTIIGIYFGFVRKQATSNDYLLGGKKMSTIPISISLIASVLSGITLLVIPVDVYSYGITYWFSVPIFILTNIMTYIVYMPVFYELQVTSTFEYLKYRFNVTVSSFASVVFTISQILYLPIVVYVPALALSRATGINVHVITPVVCIVCIFYTSFGGLKAVVWTDVLQFVVMISSVIVVFCLGLTSTGGLANIWERNLKYGRLDVSFSADVTKRDTFWSSIIGLSLNWVTYFTYNQGFVQKCISLPNYKAVKSAIIIFAIGLIAIMSISIFTGLIMFAKYWNCDPLVSGKINQPDELLPYYIMDIARTVPGLPGLFIAGIFSAALSTLSAVINCLCASIYEDFISRYVTKGTSEKTISNYLKILAIIIGSITTILVYVVPYLGNLLPVCVSIGSIAGGTLLGLYTSAVLIPAVNAKGALYGGITSIIFTTWIVFGAQYYRSIKVITYTPLPIGIDGCQNFTLANITTRQSFQLQMPKDTPFVLYRITFYYYTLLGVLVSIIIGLIVSKLTPQHNKPLRRKYFSPVIRKFIKDADALPPSYDYLVPSNKTSGEEEELQNFVN